MSFRNEGTSPSPRVGVESSQADLTSAQRIQIQRRIFEALLDLDDPFGVIEEVDTLIDNALELFDTFSTIAHALTAVDALNLLHHPTFFAAEFEAIRLLYTNLWSRLRDRASEEVAHIQRYTQSILVRIQDPDIKLAVKIASLLTFIAELEEQLETAENIKKSFDDLLQKLTDFASRLHDLADKAGRKVGDEIRKIEEEIERLKREIQKQKNDFDDYDEGPPKLPISGGTAALATQVGYQAYLTATATAAKVGAAYAGSTACVAVLEAVAPVAILGLAVYGIWAAVDTVRALKALEEIARLKRALALQEEALRRELKNKEDLAMLDSTVSASTSLLEGAIAKLCTVSGIWQAITLDARSLLELMQSSTTSPETLADLAFIATMFYTQLARAFQSIASRAYPRPESAKPAGQVAKAMETLVDHFAGNEKGTEEILPQCESWPTLADKRQLGPRVEGKELSVAELEPLVQRILSDWPLLRDINTTQDKLLGTLTGMGAPIRGFTSISQTSTVFSDKLRLEYDIDFIDSGAGTTTFEVPGVQVYSFFGRISNTVQRLAQSQVAQQARNRYTTYSEYRASILGTWYRIYGPFGNAGGPNMQRPGSGSGHPHTTSEFRERWQTYAHLLRMLMAGLFSTLTLCMFLRNIEVWPLTLLPRGETTFPGFWVNAVLFNRVPGLLTWSAYAKWKKEKKMKELASEHPGFMPSGSPENDPDGNGPSGHTPGLVGGHGPSTSTQPSGGSTTNSGGAGGEANTAPTTQAGSGVTRDPHFDLTAAVKESNVESALEDMVSLWKDNWLVPFFRNWTDLDGAKKDMGFWESYAKCTELSDPGVDAHVCALNLIQLSMLTPLTKIVITDEGLYRILSSLDAAYTAPSKGTSGIERAAEVAEKFKGVPRPLMAQCLQAIVIKRELVGK